MSDNSNEKKEDWLDEDDSGFYGEPEDWFGGAAENPAGRPEPETEAPAAEDVPKDTSPIKVFRETEPEEERTEWAEDIRISESSSEDFVPELADLPEETEESGKKGRFAFPGIFFGRKKKTGPEPEPQEAEEPSGKRFGAFINKKALRFAALGALCAVAVFVIVLAATRLPKTQKAGPEKETEPEEVIITENVGVSSVRHLSFPRLSVEETEDTLSVNEFSQILATLYERGYVLVDPYAIASIGVDGKAVLSEEVEVPEGKKPLLLSQRDVPDTENREPGLFADKLVVSGEGYITSQYDDGEGSVWLEDLDVIPVVETFLRDHPDFSFDGAKGIAALTGYNGILGYDLENDSESEKNMADILREAGWHFASNGFRGISYGSEYSLIESDTSSWEEVIRPIAGNTDLIILPRKTDIGSFAPYSADNPKFTLLHGCGFRYYFIHAPETPGFLQAGNGFVRQAICEIDTAADFQKLLDEGAI